jgi:hypothetical protein
MTSVKIKLITYGSGCILAHPQATPGEDGPSPIVEITGTDGVQPRHVLRAFERCFIWPMRYSIPWAAIKDARQGQIVRL